MESFSFCPTFKRLSQVQGPKSPTVTSIFSQSYGLSVSLKQYFYLVLCFFQGGFPSPFDRLCGTRQAIKAYHFLIEQIEANKNEHGKPV